MSFRTIRRTAGTWILSGVDVMFVVATAYLCWTLVWCGGPFEGMGSIFPGIVLGPPVVGVAAIYFGVCAAWNRRVIVPLACFAGVIAVSAFLIATNVVQKARWAHARPAVLALAVHPPSRGQTEHRWLGTYLASVHTNPNGTVLVAFDNSWDGLLYVPPALPAPDRNPWTSIGPEMMPRWWYYDTD